MTDSTACLLLYATEDQLNIVDSIQDSSDVKAMVAALTYILSNAAKYDLDLDTLFVELQQMGMPRGMSNTSTMAHTSERERERESMCMYEVLMAAFGVSSHRALHCHVETIHRTQTDSASDLCGTDIKAYDNKRICFIERERERERERDAGGYLQ
jgi:hypothetical protein